MAQPQIAQERDEPRERAASEGPEGWSGGWRLLFWSCGLVMAANIFLWVWDYKFMYTAGLNSASPEFSKYYMTLFWGELLVLGVFTGVWYGVMVRKGRKVVTEPIPNREEIRRLTVLWSLVGVTSLSIYIEASFWPNWDGAWHQTMVRDTALTPTHIPMFYFFFPLSAILAVGTYLYGRFWIPTVYGKEKGFPWSFFLLISAAVLEVVQVAFNEWGHSLWLSEEFFAAPFHWPFVSYGWLAAGMFAVWGETILRLFEIEKAEDEAQKTTGAVAEAV